MIGRHIEPIYYVAEKWRPVSYDGCFAVQRGPVIPVADGGGYRYRVVERLHDVGGRMVYDFTSLQAVRDFIDSCRQGHDDVYHDRR
jgi:hypothetical protein